MKRMLFAGAVALTAATPAFAADLPQPAAPPPQAPAAYIPPAPPIYNWGGVYVGLNGGYGFGNSNWGDPVDSGDFSISGGLVGGTIGANFQTGQFVYGIEADGDWSDIKGSSTPSAATAFCTAATFFPCTYQTSNDWLATVRGRVGYAFDRVLLYATAGGAFGNVKAMETDATGSGSSSSTEFGWAAGAGVEYALTDSITAKVEYLFVDLSSGSCTPTCLGTVTTTAPVSFDASLIRGGLNFKFGGF